MADNQTAKTQLERFRMVAIAEGISFIILLLFAMPLKYLFHFPAAVKYTGWLHGALFITYIIFAVEVYWLLHKNFIWLVKAVAAAVIPLGTFIFDKSLKKEATLLH